jgi:hypothetical protein
MSGYSRAVVAGGLAIALAALVPSMAGCDALGKIGTTAHDAPTTSATISGRVTAVVIDSGSGSVDVTGSGRSTVEVSQQASYSTVAPVAHRTLTGTTLTLSYTCKSELSCSVSYTLQVPRGVAVRVSAGSGAITLTSLAGPVSATTSAGEIIADDLRSGSVTLGSDAGGIIATCTVPPRSLHASTKLGAITLSVPSAVAYKISTHTFVGASTVSVRRSASSAYAISASSDVGSISISPS